MSATSSPPSTDALNQPPPLARPQRVRGARRAAGGAAARGRGLGRGPRCARSARSPAARTCASWGRLANENPPVLRTHDRYGHRIDEVEFHPAYHELMDARGRARPALAALDASREPGAHVARAAMFMTLGQAEGGHGCPISMTYSAVPALRATPELAAEWEPRLTSTPTTRGSSPPPRRPARCSAWR